MKRIVTQEHSDGAGKAPQDFQLEEESRSGEILFTGKLSNDTSSGTTLESGPS